ncbi:RNA pseudouridine synthase [Aliikangiella marina]|uniref:Dual-specificity RNA pseudouridine synthase RluA n=1 Tax=Aliikangiella marina TaxID=1712262 RepID=A0A545T4F8_9GAMM|nr:pseudouridine synthase [Aliikangiella marina]TQV72005.1 RNA pseudouridine synthase [Aliikangiella marina]TQV72058.1 RNA pseudouridine synthase [Aliikangiella marina]
MLLNYQPPINPYLTIIYRDEDIVVCDKPSGLLSVRGKARAHQDSLQFRCELVWPNIGVVHRLDMGTSGIMMMALNRNSLSHLSKQFQQRTTQKTYIADIWGRPAQNSGTVELPLIVDWPKRPRQKVCFETGKSAITHWKLIDSDSNANHSRVQLTPITGRSHQLRVHMAELGYPIIGDKFYAKGDALLASSRLHLHAHKLSVLHPRTNEILTFESPIPF